MIEEILTGDGESTSTFPSVEVSEILVDAYDRGKISLKAKTPGGEWRVINQGYGWRTVMTPDSGVEYKFVAQGLDAQSVRVYFGP